MHLAPSVLWDTCWANGISLVCIDPGRGRSFHTGLSLARLGFHGSQAGNISIRMLCLSEASFLFSALTNTLLSIRRAVTLPLLAPLCSLIIFSLPLPHQSLLTPYLQHLSCLPWPWPIRQSPRVWCVFWVWPFQERRTRRSGRGSRRRRRGGTTDASGR